MMSFKINISSAKILVVDDEPEITEIVETFLSEHGYQVLTENDPSQVIEKANNFKPDAILLDIMMPGGMDGYELCSEIKKNPEHSNTPIIFLTGKDRQDDMGRSFKSGGDMFIKKPFSCERLLEIVNIVMMSSGKF